MALNVQHARFVGLLYLAVALTAPFGLVYVPSKIMVAGDVSTTVANLTSNQLLYRFGLASEIVHQVICVFLVLGLYNLFKITDEALSKPVVVFGALVSVPIMFMNTLNGFAALFFVSGADYLSSFTPAQLETFAFLFLRLHELGVLVTCVFWGLWLFPLARLVWRCGGPRLVSLGLVVAGTTYLIVSTVVFLLPQHESRVLAIAPLFEMGEIGVMFWLLFYGCCGKAKAAND